MSEPFSEQLSEHQESLNDLAGLLMQAGCDVVLGVSATSQVGVLMISEAIPRLKVVQVLRDMADMIERDDMKFVGEATVTIDDEE